MPRHLLSALTFLLLTSFGSSAFAQYNSGAGRSQAPAAEAVSMDYVDSKGVKQTKVVERKVARDQYGNASGAKYDLAVDGAFEGQTVLVLQLYTMESNFDFVAPRAALKEKGFSVFRWSGAVPPIKEFREALAKSNQFWLIAGDTPMLSKEHIAAIKEFFDAGHGIYIWGDNQPFYADANVLAAALLDSGMDGNLAGGSTVQFSEGDGKPGLKKDHLITTGLEYVFEGITIATIRANSHMTPIIWGSAGNLVTVAYDQGGKRAILDGGFTRLYCNWDTAGTGRYVKNAASWLANYERFGDKVVAEPFKKGGKKISDAPEAKR
jgi:hypothetical protein